MSDTNDAGFHVRFWVQDGGPYVPEVDYWVSLAVPDQWLIVEEGLIRDGLMDHPIWGGQSRLRVRHLPLTGGSDLFFPRFIRWLEALCGGAEDCGFVWHHSGRIAGAFRFDWQRGLEVCFVPPPEHTMNGQLDGEWRWHGVGGTRETVVRSMYGAFCEFIDSEAFRSSTPNRLSLLDALRQRCGVGDEQEWVDVVTWSHPLNMRRGAARLLQAALHGVPCRPPNGKHRTDQIDLAVLCQDANDAAWDPDLELIERNVLTDAWDRWNGAEKKQHLIEVAFRLGPESYNTEYRNPATLRSPLIESWLENTPLTGDDAAEEKGA